VVGLCSVHEPRYAYHYMNTIIVNISDLMGRVPAPIVYGKEREREIEIPPKRETSGPEGPKESSY
jgi:hypothetical protein